MPIFDLKCQKEHITLDVLLKHNDPLPACPECGSPCEKVWLNHAVAVIGDDIPGGLLIKHGLCNEDGSPRRYYSKSEIAREAKRRELVNYVEHTPPPGTDKSRHTQRWASISADQLKAAEELVRRHYTPDEPKEG